ncbi:MAG: trypsin-like peptidase domain-containing protein [Phycisphaerales bacterium]|nr:trypsin-like peptidase domain-containing protein [Phycisphaerales bacterium]
MAGLSRRFLRAALLVAVAGWTLGKASHAVPTAIPEGPTHLLDETDLADIEKKAIRAIDRVAESTVLVTFRGRAGSSASGVIIDSKGLVLTAGHVGDQPGRRGVITLPDGREFRGRTLGQIFEGDVDLGLIQIQNLADDELLPAVELAPKNGIQDGDWVLTLGYAAAISEMRQSQPAARIGRIVAVDGGEIAVDSPFDAGDSGGPIIDLDGRLVGIVSRCGHESWQNIGTGVDAIHEFLPRLESQDLGDLDTDLEDWNGNTGRRSARATKRDPRFLATLDPLTSPTKQGIVELRNDDRLVTFGTVVGENRVIAKASLFARQSRNAMAVFTSPATGRTVAKAAKPLAIDAELDLVLLEVPGVSMPASLKKIRVDPVESGTLLIVTDDDGDAAAFGIVARDVDSLTNENAIEDRPFIGIAYEATRRPSGLRITKVVPSSSAARAGLAVNDVLLTIDGRPVQDRRGLSAEIGNAAIGDRRTLALDRDGDRLDIELELGIRPGGSTRGLPGNTSTGVSRVSGGFGDVFLIDADVPAHAIGSPVVDLKGDLVGWTVARRSRTSLVVVPWSRVLESLDRLEPDEDDASRRLCAYRVLVTEGNDGSIGLEADDAFPVGDEIRREKLGPEGGTTWGFWTDADDALAWTIRVDQPGRFQVTLEQACPRRDSGTPIRLTIGDHELDGRVESTEGSSDFAEFSLGEIEIDKIGEMTAVLKPLASPRNSVMNFARLRLDRLPAPPTLRTAPLEIQKEPGSSRDSDLQPRGQP